jgi:hypothetical protein
MKNIFIDRTLTSFGVSIGTGLSLESLFSPTSERYDKEREIPISLDPKDYKVHYYNIYTIARNIISSVLGVKEIDTIISNKEFLNVLMDEIHIINSLYEGVDDTKCCFYAPINVKEMYLRFNNNKNSGDITKGYMEYMLLKPVITNMLTKITHVNIVTKIPKGVNNILIFSHHTYDTVYQNNYAYSLESHTGKLKSIKDMCSKYHTIGKRDLLHLPYTPELLYIFGDKHMVKPLNISIRKKLYDISIEKGWTPRTTKDMVKFEIKRNKEVSDYLSEHNYKLGN